LYHPNARSVARLCASSSACCLLSCLRAIFSSSLTSSTTSPPMSASLDLQRRLSGPVHRSRPRHRLTDLLHRLVPTAAHHRPSLYLRKARRSSSSTAPNSEPLTQLGALPLPSSLICCLVRRRLLLPPHTIRSARDLSHHCGHGHGPALRPRLENTNTRALEQLSQQRHFRSLCGPGHVRSRVNTDV
jgi:hypothetical protein